MIARIGSLCMCGTSFTMKKNKYFDCAGAKIMATIRILNLLSPLSLFRTLAAILRPQQFDSLANRVEGVTTMSIYNSIFSFPLKLYSSIAGLIFAFGRAFYFFSLI